MSLPKLESLFVQPTSDFNTTNVPQTVHLSKLFICLTEMNLDVVGTAISKMIRRMPKLHLLAIKNYSQYREGVKIVDIVCRSTAVTTSQDKKVLMTVHNKSTHDFSTYLKIEREQNERDLGSHTLNRRQTAFGFAKEKLEHYLKTHSEVATLTFYTFEKDSLTLFPGYVEKRLSVRSVENFFMC